MTQYTPGQAIYHNDQFVGHYVETLTDPLPFEKDNLDSMVAAGSFGHFQSPGDFTRTNYYGYRIVWNEEFGSTRQVLINFLGQFPTWINLPASAVLTPKV